MQAERNLDEEASASCGEDLVGTSLRLRVQIDEYRFILETQDILEASGFRYKFNCKNPEGQPLHVCAYSVVCNIWRV